jgi:hypothetical protein
MHVMTNILINTKEDCVSNRFSQQRCKTSTKNACHLKGFPSATTHHKFKLPIDRRFSHPFIFHCLEGTIKRAAVSTELWNQGVSSLNYTEETQFHHKATGGNNRKEIALPYMNATSDLLLLALMGIMRN